MLEIFGISMKCGSEFRVMVKATDEMNKAWLDIVNQECEEDEEEPFLTVEDAMAEGGLGYLSNNYGYLVMEVVIDTDIDGYDVIYYFDNYETLDVAINDDEYEQCLAFINEWKDRLPDNEKLCLGDCEWVKRIPDDIPWKHNVC